MTPELLVDRGGDGVATVTFNRPETLNALTFESYRALRDTFRGFAAEANVRAVILTGAGRGFCSGGDRRKIVAALGGMTSHEILQFTRLTGDCVLAMRELEKPVVAAVGGAAVGAGAVLALAADFRVASERARFGFVFSKLGLSGADMGAAWLLPRIVGLARATELLMLGHIIDADVANGFGLINDYVPHDELQPAARALAARLAAGPREAHAVTKRMLNREAHLDLAAAIEAEAVAQAACLQTEAFREAARRYGEE
ncbi:MAG TPA: enoyl-CoA hydratase-related protein [Polyangia bacterium]|nr:enoyl-CoA hydratase-related protein [Polyangia bacterium]